MKLAIGVAQELCRQAGSNKTISFFLPRRRGDAYQRPRKIQDGGRGWCEQGCWVMAACRRLGRDRMTMDGLGIFPFPMLDAQGYVISYTSQAVSVFPSRVCRRCSGKVLQASYWTDWIVYAAATDGWPHPSFPLGQLGSVRGCLIVASRSEIN